MDKFKYAVLCVDDDPVILQLIDFQMKEILRPLLSKTEEN